MGSYSLLEEVWDKPLVENQDLLVNQRGPYENSGPIARNLKTTTSAQTYASVPHQYEPQNISSAHTLANSNPPIHHSTVFRGYCGTEKVRAKYVVLRKHSLRNDEIRIGFQIHR